MDIARRFAGPGHRAPQRRGQTIAPGFPLSVFMSSIRSICWFLLLAAPWAHADDPRGPVASRALEESDCVTAVPLIEAGAQEGIAGAQQQMAYMYYMGRCKDKDLRKSYEWTRKAAEAGLPEAQLHLAVFLDKGEGVAADPLEAISWYERAAGNGHPYAQLNLGIILMEGRGVTKDVARGADLVDRAARQGLANAQHILATLYIQGDARPKDFAKVVAWERKAAQQGHNGAFFNLGIAAEGGFAQPKSRALAYVFYRLAALRGFEEAPHEVDRLSARFSADHLKVLNELAAQWRPGADLPAGLPFD